MNKHILFVMRNLDNPELFTQEEKEVNRKSANTAYVAAYAGAAYAAYDAADAAAYDAAYAAAAYAAYDAAAEHWVGEFFNKTGEDKQTYINEVERLKGNNNMHYDEQREAAMQQQVGGTHYKELRVQPLELTLKNMGFLAFEGACYTKINKYMIRNKDNKVEQLKKAQHVLNMWIEEAEKQQ